MIWHWIWLQSRSLVCSRYETPHGLQLKLHLATIASNVARTSMLLCAYFDIPWECNNNILNNYRIWQFKGFKNGLLKQRRITWNGTGVILLTTFWNSSIFCLLYCWQFAAKIGLSKLKNMTQNRPSGFCATIWYSKVSFWWGHKRSKNTKRKLLQKYIKNFYFLMNLFKVTYLPFVWFKDGFTHIDSNTIWNYL